LPGISRLSSGSTGISAGAPPAVGSLAIRYPYNKWFLLAAFT
jgi:hypothetical protein